MQNRQGWAQVPAETLQPGDLVVVLPGDCVPVDGIVVEGTSSLNESALTGEPMPVTVSSGAAAPPTLSYTPITGCMNLPARRAIAAGHPEQNSCHSMGSSSPSHDLVEVL